ncbi:hypothetical protein VTK26DRAFT_8609 [Humicola hyalothermophila]
MGNSPSTSKNASQSSSSQNPPHDERPGTTTSTAAGQPSSTSTPSRPKPTQHRPGVSSGFSTASSSVTAASSASSAKPVEVKQIRPGPCHEAAKPVAVPNPHNSPSSPRSPRSPRSEEIYETAVMPHSSLQDVSYLTRPPRLPLPIEEEVHTPGSPIIAPTDLGQPLEDVEGLDRVELIHRASTLSETSAPDEDESGELLVDKTRPTVPTRLEWRHGGDKVYVTGTIFQWNRKTRLHRVEGQPGVFATTINILPGTHHIRFLVDGQMQTSPDLPTTVDFGNNLVNYIEVAPDDLEPAPSHPAGAPTGPDDSPLAQAKAPPGEEKGKVPRENVPAKDQFANRIPKYLLDLDQPEDSPVYHSAVAATEKLPNPPALPGFLGKPILNAATLIKDDNSVLNMPNHTVLNHLATSSIKNNVLAVSATTRYKNKYVTTIMYKPTTTEGI